MRISHVASYVELVFAALMNSSIDTLIKVLLWTTAWQNTGWQIQKAMT